MDSKKPAEMQALKNGEEMKKAVIIGAGQTGRGFIAPIMKDNHYQITFIDKDLELINMLREKKEYIIRYFGDVKEPVKISSYNAFSNDDKNSEDALVDSDVVCTSVFSSNLKYLADLLKRAQAKREIPLKIICCENGVDVKKDLVDSGLSSVITEGIIFCTTLRPQKDSLDLICEDVENLPIDGSVKGLDVDIHRMPLEMHFSDLIQRKIYTYNFMSAVVAYLGWYKGYEVYGDAGNDVLIDQVIQRLKPVISRVIAKKYNITFDEQSRFTQQAINKFQNRDIYDTIYRNARQTKRKLGLHERLLFPLQLAIEQDEPINDICFILAAAMTYAEKEEGEDLSDVYEDLKTILVNEQLNKVKELHENMSDSKPLEEIVQTL